MQRILLRLFFILTIATFFVPLVVVPGQFIFPFIVPKVLLFRSLVIVMGAIYVLLYFSNKEQFKPRQGLMLWVSGGFLLSFGISTFFGTDWYRSFWDNHERMLGLFTLIHYWLYAVMVGSVIRGKEAWQKLFFWFLIPGTLVMGLGVWQKIHPDFLLNRGAGRVSSTLGNAIYFSGYGLFLFFVSLFIVVGDRTVTGVKRMQKYWWTLAIGFLGLLGIFFGGTRGTLLGLLAGLTTALIFYVVKGQAFPNIRRVSMGVLLLGVFTLAGLFVFRQTEFVRSIPAVGRLVNTSFEAESTGTRVMAWGIAAKAWKDYPIFGWGPNNYYFAFNKYYRPEFLRHGWAETWFDNAHNTVMNTLATQGAVGLIFYLGLFGAALVVVWRAQKRNDLSFHATVVTIAFIIAHFIHNIFVFENPTSYLYFFFFVGYLISLGQTYVSRPEKEKNAVVRPLSFGVIGIVAAVTVLIIFSTDYNPKRANNAAFIVIQKLYRIEPTILDTYVAAASIPTPHIDDVRNDIGRAMTGVIPQLVEKGQKELAQKMSNVAYTELQKNKALHPFDIRVHIQLAQLAQQDAELFGEPQRYIDAMQLLEEALGMSPKRQQVIFSLGPLKAQLGQKEEAVRLMRQAVDSDPTIGEAWWRLAYLQEALGQHAEALVVIREAEEIHHVEFVSPGKEVIEQIKAKK